MRRHLTKNRPGLPQKSSETPHNALFVERGGDPRPAAQEPKGVVAPLRSSKLSRQLLYTRRIVVFADLGSHRLGFLSR